MMKVLLISIFLCLFGSFSTLAHGDCVDRAQNFTGAKAEGLIQALMFAGVKATFKGDASDGFLNSGTATYTLPQLSCQDTHAYSDGLTRFDCVTPLISDNARAKVLADAMDNLGIAGDSGMGHSFYVLSKISCLLTVPDNGSAQYQCQATGTWASDCQ